MGRTKEQYRRGDVVLLQKVVFPDGVTKPKYCVLMEDYINGMEDLVIVFTTHRLEFASRETTILAPAGKIKGIKGNTVIQCDNYHIVNAEQFFKNAKFLDSLEPEAMEKIDEAITYIQDIDEETLIRMLPK